MTQKNDFMNWITNTKGGPGSGNFNHMGRPGKIGGSQPESAKTPHSPDAFDVLFPDEPKEPRVNLTKAELRKLQPKKHKKYTAVGLEKAGKKVFNFITGFTDDLSTQIVIQKDGNPVKVNDSKPITLERMREIHGKASELAGKKLTLMTINLSAFEPGEYDGTNPLIWKRQYRYNPKHNSMIIFENDAPIYANDNGVETTDQNALYDSLYD